MTMLGVGLTLLVVTFLIGPSSLFLRSHSDNMFNDFLTVSEIEDRIRRIRLENKALEDELAQLSGSDSSN
jgi:hypothetical protein